MKENKEEKVPEAEETKPTKKTFSTSMKYPRVSVSSKIKEFQDLARGGECVIGCGYCVKHNEKLVREVRTKKMSTCDKNGMLNWTMGEVTILACPVNTRQAGRVSAGTTTSLMTSQPTDGGTTNKKMRISTKYDVDQSTEGNPDKRASNDILLDT